MGQPVEGADFRFLIAMARAGRLVQRIDRAINILKSLIFIRLFHPL
jgi:hypothetical protein